MPGFKVRIAECFIKKKFTRLARLVGLAGLVELIFEKLNNKKLIKQINTLTIM